LADRRGRLIPARTERPHPLEQIRGRLARLSFGGQQSLELHSERLAIRLARLELDLVAALVAIEEEITCGAEPQPQRFGFGAADRTDGLPLRLQTADLSGAALPLARLGELFGARAQRFLLRLVRGPYFLALREVLVASTEELVARLAEALPHDARVGTRHRADRLPFELQLLQL